MITQSNSRQSYSLIRLLKMMIGEFLRVGDCLMQININMLESYTAMLDHELWISIFIGMEYDANWRQLFH